MWDALAKRMRVYLIVMRVIKTTVCTQDTSHRCPKKTEILIPLYTSTEACLHSRQEKL